MHRLDRFRVAALAGAVLLLAAPSLAGEMIGKLITRAEKQIIEHYFDAVSENRTKSQGWPRLFGTLICRINAGSVTTIT